MLNRIIEAVLKITGRQEDDIIKLKIEALLNEILSYLNRDEVTEEMFPVVANIIAEYIKHEAMQSGNIQSFSEGDISVTYMSNSPFFGRLESFKLIRGIH